MTIEFRNEKIQNSPNDLFTSEDSAFRVKTCRTSFCKILERFFGKNKLLCKFSIEIGRYLIFLDNGNI